MQVVGREESSVVLPSCAPTQATRIAWKALPAGAMWNDYGVDNHPLSGFLPRKELIASRVNLVKTCG